MKNNLLTSPDERKARTQRNREMITRFLRDEIFTDTEVLTEVLGFRHSNSVNKILEAMVRDDLLIKYRNGRKCLWGINKNGFVFSYNKSEEIPENFKTFRPSKFNPVTFEHRKQMQLLRIYLIESAGWSNWCSPRPVKGCSCPDAIAMSPKHGGKLVAIEFEKTLKASIRYTAILKAHLEAILSKRYSSVLYVSPNPALLRRVERMFLHLVDKPMLIAEKTVMLSNDSLHALFEFKTIDEIRR